jgi:nitroimidazol reductase NimA-like FMN-containing flavoprotein (pyridoxamine 5'-phosphate oxidase superfamily)
MSLKLGSEQVWEAINKELFAVVGMVTAKQEARTAGVVYVARDHKLYFTTGRDTWKTRHIIANPCVSVTIPIAKRVPVMPWLKIPQATITFQGVARVLAADEATPELLQALFRDKMSDAALVEGSCLIEITPVGEFVTYGVGIPLMDMREPEKARGRAPVR